jgi:hypothetical protein
MLTQKNNFMRTLTFCKALLTFALFFALTTNLKAQAPANGTTMPQAQAEKYLQKNWDDRSKLQYFSVDNAASENIGAAQKGAGVTHVRMARGKIGDAEYLFTIGVNTEGKLVGDYYLSKVPTGAVIGPCPRNCDTE